MTKHYARPLVMAAIVLTLGLGTSGCQTMSEIDPTGLLSDEEIPPDSQFPTDSTQQAAADASTTTPDLASIPARPAAPDTTAQADTTQQVATAGAQAQYSADALRAGTEAAAPVPVATDAAATKQALASNAAPSRAAQDTPPTTNNDVPPTAGSSLANGVQPAAAPPPAAAPAAAPAPPQQAASAAPPPQQVASAAPPPAATPEVAAPAPAPVRSAPIAPPPGAEPAVPAVPMTAGARTAMVNPTDAQLGFKPSSAPALNSSISQWVSPPILAHYRQTAALAGTAGTGMPAVPAVPVSTAKGRNTGGSSASGDVIANMDAVPGTPAGMAAAMNGGVPPTAIIYFTGDGTALSVAARNQVRDAVAAFRASGGAGTVKVVGHASSRTSNMSVERHLEVIFQKSQARANAVAQALIHAGIPADKVQVEAVGDSQPVYYESMPKGEDGNRRAEIFVQS
ncbi:MAG TPA: OmpA family protein [Rhizomicrobium sp.]|jgi:outer membrane protein OmpA-like peptidoglycan-associated protein